MKVNKTWLAILLVLIILAALVIVGVGMKKQETASTHTVSEITSVSVIQPRTTDVSTSTEKVENTTAKSATSKIKGTDKVKKSTEKTTIKTTTKKKTTTTTKKTISTTKAKTTKRAQSVELYSVKKESGKYVLYLGDRKASSYTNLLKTKIPELSSQTKYYYFNKGIYDPTYSGLVPVDNNKVYWVENGTWDQSYAGIVEYNGTKYIMTDGKIRFDFTGTANVDGKNYQIYKGAIVS